MMTIRIPLLALSSLLYSLSANAQWVTDASASASAGYDDNVFVQSVGPDANKSSMVTTLGAKLSATYSNADFSSVFTYAPSGYLYHSYHKEDHLDHLLQANAKLAYGDWDMTFNHLVKVIQGTEESMFFPAPSPATFLGGVAIRDRRSAIVYKVGYQAQRSYGDFFIEPLLNIYYHDFQANERVLAGYINLIDRYDVHGGFNVGYAPFEQDEWHLLLGYRMGEMWQGKRPNSNIRYTNTYHRVLAGVRGQVTPWLSLDVLAGPDFRSFDDTTAAGFDRGKDFFYINAGATADFGDYGKLKLTAVRYALVAFSGASIYEDITYAANYSYQATDDLILNAGLKIYEGDWASGTGVNRRETAYTPSFGFSWQYNPNISFTGDIAFDTIDSDVANTEAREYERTLINLGVRYSF